MLTQCTPLDVQGLLYTLITVYTPIGDEGCPEGEPAVHTCTVYMLPVGDEGCLSGR